MSATLATVRTTQTLTDQLFKYLQEQHPRSWPGVSEALQSNPVRFQELVEKFLRWLSVARGQSGFLSAVDAFVEFTTEINMAQARYERAGKYAALSFDEVYASHYSDDAAMDDYLWGLFLANFLWHHHFEISLLYVDHFLTRLNNSCQIVELAPGHGGWGVWALSCLPNASLLGYDISPQAIRVAQSVASAANVAGRAEFRETNVLDLDANLVESADAIVSCCLAEHLTDPRQLFASIHRILRPRSWAFVTVALTAAQVDHVYEFRRESEVVTMCEDHGLRVVEMLSSGPKRTLPNAKFLPRSVAVIVQKRTSDYF